MTQRNPDGLPEHVIKQLVETHSGKLTRYVYYRTHQLELSRDLVQEAFLRLMTARRQPTGEHVVPWLYSVCRNLTIDSQRRQSRWVSNGVEILDHYSASAEPNPLESTIQSETLRMVYSCMEQLPDRHREVMVLKFQSGLSYKAIAGITGLSVSNVGFLIHHSVKRLRYEMAKMV